MTLFDTHCHLDVSAFDADRAAVLARARAVGVESLLVPATDSRSWEGLVRLCRNDDHLYPALGLHPVYERLHQDADIEALGNAVAKHRPCAIGEIGLDWVVEGADRKRQQKLFEQQLEIAEDTALPVVLHARKSHEDILRALKHRRLKGGFCHAFNGSRQQAERYLAMGFRLGFGGMLTFARSTHLRRLAQDLPLSAIVLETDAPDMTVASHRFQRNSPEYMPEVLASLAELRDEAPAEIARQTTANARSTLRLNEAGTAGSESAERVQN